MLAGSRPIRALWLLIGSWVGGRAVIVAMGPLAKISTKLSASWHDGLPHEDFAIADNVPEPSQTAAHVAGVQSVARDVGLSKSPATAAVRPAAQGLLTRQQSPDMAKEQIRTLPPHQTRALLSKRFRVTLPALQIEGVNRPVTGSALQSHAARADTIAPRLALSSTDAPPPQTETVTNTAPLPLAQRSAPRFQTSAWALIRGGGASVQNGAGPLGDSGQLGGSQMGFRTSYALDARPSISLTARVSTPLSSTAGTEIALGIALKPLKTLPITIIVERRIALDSAGRDDFELLAAGGVYDRPLGHNMRVNAYSQLGVVGVTRRDAFADGSIEVEHPLVKVQNMNVAFGGGAWGAAQPGVSRLDAGPEVLVRARFGPATLKLTASYRLRIAGDAAPDTGPAISLGADF